MAGILIYAVLLPLVFFPFGFEQQQPFIAYLFSAAMLIISILRLVHYFYTPTLYQRSRSQWLWSFSLLSLSHSAIIGTLFAFALADERFHSIVHVLFLAFGGVTAAALMALSPRIILALLGLYVMVIPGLITALAEPHLRVFVPMLFVFIGYLTMLGVRIYREYSRAFKIEMELEAQREELEHINKIDPLTHISNRGHFNTTFEFNWHKGARQRKVQTLLLIDVDHFKPVNDSYGHLLGDKCLQHVAAGINHIAKRKTDLVARFGGEEFAVLLSDVSADNATRLAEAIRAYIASQPFEHEDITLPVTVSIGVASMLPAVQINPNQLIDNADKALYQAKEQGRNQVVCWHPQDDMESLSVPR